MLNKYNTVLLGQGNVYFFPNQTLKMSKEKQNEIKATWGFV